MERGEDHVILVDENDNQIGIMEKMEAHRKGLLHRAFSIFIFNRKGELLLQKRAITKYHTGGLWSNACCSHPCEGEPIDVALQRKLLQEMGMNCQLEKAFNFTYKSNLDNGLTEHELDHVYIGICDQRPKPNPDEVSDWKFVTEGFLLADIAKNPDHYTPWFKLLVVPSIANLKALVKK